MTSSILEIMLPAFAECLVLTGLHAYLGLHVLRRRVIFVDLTLAQIAALGTTVGLLFGMSTASLGAYVLSLGLTVIGAAVFAATRLEDERVPHEAIIGLVYAIAAALAILLVSQGIQGAKQVKSIMTGSLLWVDWSTVGVTAVVYGSLGLLHYLLRGPFLQVSDDPGEAARRGLKVWLWDFLFYVSFGVAISLSVKTAGVLLVFVFLVVPAMVAVTLASELSVQVIIGWVFGTLVTATGLALSYALSLPSGPTVVALYGTVLVPFALVMALLRAQDRRLLLRRLAAGSGIATALVLGFFALGRGLAGTSWAEAADAGHHHHAHGQLLAGPHPEHGATPAEATPSGQDAHGATQGDTERAAEVPLEVEGHLDDPSALLAVLRSSDAFPFDKDEAARALDELAGQAFGFDPEANEAANAAAIARIEAWLSERDADASAEQD